MPQPQVDAAPVMVRSDEFFACGWGLRFKDLGFWVQRSGLRVCGLEFEVKG